MVMENPITETTILYGKQQLCLHIPQNTVVQKLREPKKVVTPVKFAGDLQDYLQKTVLDLSKTILVIADKTRLCGYPEYLPIVIEELLRAGMHKEEFKVIIAYGTHPPQSEDECMQGYGSIYKKFNFVHHNCQMKEGFTELGTTSRRTPIRVRKDLLNATTVITMGAVCHHYFAGYGGGRKLIFPGCGEKNSIYTNHGLYLDHETSTLAPGCQPGNFEGNPLAQDLFEIEEAFTADLAIHGILNSRGEMCDLLLGNGSEFFKQACAIHGKNFEVAIEQFDTVVASCGGYPKDINFIQSHKAVHNAAMNVRDGGLLLIYCECCDGIGSMTFLPWFDTDSFESAFAKLAERYEGNGGTALAMMTKLQRIRIGLVTSLEVDTCKKMGVELWHHQQVNDHLLTLTDNHRLTIIPNASLLVNVKDLRPERSEVIV